MSVAKVVEVLRKDPFAKYHLDLYRQIVGFDRELFKIWLNFKQGKIGEFTDYNRIYDFFFSKQEKFGGVRVVFFSFVSLETQNLFSALPSLTRGPS